MKKKYFCILLVMCFLCLIGCEKKTPEKWYYSLTITEQSTSENYVITWSDDKVVSNTGKIFVRNQSDFDITIHLAAEDEEERTLDLQANNPGVLYEIKRDTEYQVGVHADEEKDTTVKFFLSDDEVSEPW